LKGLILSGLVQLFPDLQSTLHGSKQGIAGSRKGGIFSTDDSTGKRILKTKASRATCAVRYCGLGRIERGAAVKFPVCILCHHRKIQRQPYGLNLDLGGNSALQLFTGAPMPEFREPTHAEISQRAYELFVKSGCEPGKDLEHWLAAECQLNDLALHQALRAEADISARQEWPRAPKEKSVAGT